MVPLLPILLATLSAAYIPSSPTNSTQDAIANGLNINDTSTLSLHWYPNSSYTDNVSYRLPGNVSEGINKGILVHFSEEFVNELTPPTSTPWIAMVSCDFNVTNASMETDIFTLAGEKGAVAVLLYSLYSSACVINPEYIASSTFNLGFDVFSTQSKTSSHLIESQFSQLKLTNTNISIYDSQRLNDTADSVKGSIEKDQATKPGFLYAVLRAHNATINTNDTVVAPTNGANTNVRSSRSTTSLLTMIILYFGTSCISAYWD